MLTYVLTSLLQRRTRTVVTILGVALGVVLVLVITGMAHGQLAERGRREANAGAQIIVRPAGTGLSNVGTVLSMPPADAENARSVDGVDSVVGVGVATQQAQTGFGWRTVDGVEYDEYARMSGLSMVEGRPFAGPHEAIVDKIYARDHSGAVGQTIDFGGSAYTIVGVYAPESLSRIKVPLSSMQEYYDANGAVSMLLVKIREGESAEAVAGRLRQKLPDQQILLASDLPNFYAQGIPALHTFLGVVVGLAVIISALVTMLTMYTSVIERTRQIGVFKSLGASKMFIATVVESEAFVISLLGIAFGFAGAWLIALAIERITHLPVEFESAVFARTAAFALASGLVGAVYPAVRAAALDPVEALAYE